MKLRETPPPGFVTRFAPAPTGFLHLGHVASALMVWGVARAFGGRVLLRIEDHDATRSRPEFERALLADLEWLGFIPDAAPIRQSDRAPLYARALDRLRDAGLVYPCVCSRKAIGNAATPDAGETRYPGTCRALREGSTQAPTEARRVRLEAGAADFDDLALGPLTQVPAEQCGDVLVRDRRGQWTYQFAVVVDDLDQGVDLVIRGDDLLPSTGRQIQIARLLGRERPPRFLHHPLITRADGRKLSKSNRDTGVRDLRDAGVTADQVLGQAAAALGLARGEPVTLGELANRFRESARL